MFFCAPKIFFFLLSLIFSLFGVFLSCDFWQTFDFARSLCEILVWVGEFLAKFDAKKAIFGKIRCEMLIFGKILKQTKNSAHMFTHKFAKTNSKLTFDRFLIKNTNLLITLHQNTKFLQKIQHIKLFPAKTPRKSHTTAHQSSKEKAKTTEN